MMLNRQHQATWVWQQILASSPLPARRHPLCHHLQTYHRKATLPAAREKSQAQWRHWIRFQYQWELAQPMLTSQQVMQQIAQALVPM